MTTTSPDDRTLDTTRSNAPLPGGCVAAVAGALVLAACNLVIALTPGADDVGSTADLLRIARREELLYELGIGLGLLACLLLVPGVWATGARLSPRSRSLSAAGAWLAGSGYIFSMVLSVESMVVLAVARAGGDPAAFVAAMDGHTPLTALVTYVVFGLGALAGIALLGVAALRQQGGVPAWAGWALIASPVVRMGGLILGVALGPPVASLLMAAGFVGIWRGRRGVRAGAGFTS